MTIVIPQDIIASNSFPESFLRRCEFILLGLNVSFWLIRTQCFILAFLFISFIFVTAFVSSGPLLPRKRHLLYTSSFPCPKKAFVSFYRICFLILIYIADIFACLILIIFTMTKYLQNLLRDSILSIISNTKKFLCYVVWMMLKMLKETIILFTLYLFHTFCFSLLLHRHLFRIFCLSLSMKRHLFYLSCLSLLSIRHLFHMLSFPSYEWAIVLHVLSFPSLG